MSTMQPTGRPTRPKCHDRRYTVVADDKDSAAFFDFVGAGLGCQRRKKTRTISQAWLKDSWLAR